MTQSDYLTTNYLTTNYLSTALEAAAKAVQIVRDGAEGTLDIRSKGRPNNIVTQVDVASEKVIRETILAAFPDHSILGEEDGLVGDGPYRWIIDPIDGTANFARGLPHYCVSVGLEHDGKGLVGVVANPLTGDVYRAERGAGCLKNDRPVGVSGCRTVAKAYSAWVSARTRRRFGTRCCGALTRSGGSGRRHSSSRGSRRGSSTPTSASGRALGTSRRGGCW